MGEDSVKIWYDEEVDILYLSLRKGKAVDSEEPAEGIRLEYGKNRELLALEIERARERLLKPIAQQLVQEI